MAATNYATADRAANALANFAVRQGITTSAQLSAEQLPLSVLANLLDGQAGGAVLTTEAGAGITTGVGAFYRSAVAREGGLFTTRILVDLTGLASSTTDLDIIGVGASPAHLGQITAAQNGTIIGGFMQCLEAPAGGVTDIDLYAATEGTGVFDGAIGSLTETVVVTSGGAWTQGRTLGNSPDNIASGSFLYLTSGAAGTAATYTAGRILITLYGI